MSINKKSPMSPSKTPKTTPDELRGQLDYLKLPFMREHVEQLLAQAAADGWSHAELLARLVEGEAALRQDRARERRIRQARFPVLKTLDQFDFTWPVKINRLAIQHLFRLNFIQDKANAILVGGVGLGKSHLAIALGYAACEAGFRVRFTTAIDVINTLSAAHATGRLETELKKYIRPDLLVMDELGYLPIDKHGADALRVAILWAAGPRRTIDWRPELIDRASGFLDRVYRVIDRSAEVLRGPDTVDSHAISSRAVGRLGSTCRRATARVGRFIEDYRPNAALDELSSVLGEIEGFALHRIDTCRVEPADRAELRGTLAQYSIALSPFAPFVTEELWNALGETTLVASAAWVQR